MGEAEAPVQLFGRYRGKYYKEKLLWDAYRRYLKDILAHGSVDRLDEAIAYAFELGVISGKKKSLNIDKLKRESI